MADATSITNLLGSHEAVALEIWKALRNVGESVDSQLALFVKCRKATYGKAPNDPT